RTVTAPVQIGCEQTFFDVAVVLTVSPVAEIDIIEFVMEQGDEAVLRVAFSLADGSHSVMKSIHDSPT
ncbi:MAG: hypothetical protein WAW61_21720, partial [Methylococcaceae bacterium]